MSYVGARSGCCLIGCRYSRQGMTSTRRTLAQGWPMWRRHCYYYRDKVFHAQAEWLGPAEPEQLSWASGAWSNIRRAIDFSMADGEAVVGLGIALGVLSLNALFFLGPVSEIRGRVEQTLAATQASQSQVSELELGAMA